VFLSQAFCESEELSLEPESSEPLEPLVPVATDPLKNGQLEF
jgi:hypothetical protein